MFTLALVQLDLRLALQANKYAKLQGTYYELETVRFYETMASTHYIIITMAQQPYMGSGLEVTKSLTGQLAALLFLSILMCPPEPSGRQSGDLGEKWRQFLFMPVRFFYMP
jgi:hypothetical protein